MVTIYLTKDKDSTLKFWDEKPICDNVTWASKRDNVKCTFPDDIYVLKRFNLIPDTRYIYDLEITEDEFDSFIWYDNED